MTDPNNRPVSATFFRDSEAFETVATQVLPKLFQGRGADEAVRVWVPGCGSGEEVYSLAVVLLEERSRHRVRPSIQIFGSDLDSRALVAARHGRFPASIEADVSGERLNRFFVRDDAGYRVRPELRDIVLFAMHDALKDPPFSRIDLIACRDVLRRFKRERCDHLWSTFQYALNPEGYLFLGASELPEHPTGQFRSVDRTAGLYQSTAAANDRPLFVARLLGPALVRDRALRAGRPGSATTTLGEAAIHHRAIETVAPPSMLIDEAHRVVHLSESAGRYVLPSNGPLSGNVVDLVRPELRRELGSALSCVFGRKQSTLSPPIPVRFNGDAHRVQLLVKPVPESEAPEPGRAVIIFIEGAAVDEGNAAAGGSAHETVRRLSHELELAQIRLRATQDESAATNEELRVANEELQSSNEEYRSTSEELETSKEELQSVNEELQTANSDLKLKLEAISRTHGDLQNLVAATEICTLFLDPDLRIKRFADRTTDLFSITAADEGRPITDFANRLEYPGLADDARAVLAQLTPIRREERSRAGRWYDMRVRPYRTIDNIVDGVVITFFDITERRQMEQALRVSELNLRRDQRLVELSRDPIFIWEYDGGIVFWNRGSEELYGYSRTEALGKRKDRLLHTSVPGSSFAELRAGLLAAGSWSGEVRHRSKDGRELAIETRIVIETLGGARLALESARDITDRKRWESRQQLLLGELSHRVRNTLAVVQAIAHQSLRNSKSGEEFVQGFDGRLAALASAHSLLVNSDWYGADLATVAEDQLRAYRSDDPSRVRIVGEPVLLPADLATPFGLVLHELATNAAKHGALSRPTGSVSVHWTLSSGNGSPILTVIWTEQGGPAVRRPKTSGFGSALIDNGIASANVKREFNKGGLVCTIQLPLPKSGEDAAIGTL